VEGLGGLESKSDIELKLENKVTALKARLRESENTCSAQNVQIANLQGFLGKANRRIKDLENWNDHIKVALAVLGILFTSSMIIVGYLLRDFSPSRWLIRCIMSIYTLNVEYHSMLPLIAKSEADHVILMTMTLWAMIIGYIGMFQATLHSTGADWIVWPGLLFAAWWILIGKTRAVLKLFSLPVIAVATYFVLFISYHAIINLS
jgi:hypothetical protein